MKISIIMAYYQRQALLDKTLESIDRSAVKDYELIIVDDASEPPLVCDRAKIIRVEKKNKWYTCSSVAWNMGFREATGDIIIIQSPECYHVGDVLTYALDNIKSNLYFSFGCYAIDQGETMNLQYGTMPAIGSYAIKSRTKKGWYNHSIHKPMGYHFCSAILRKDLDKIGGFDERYAHGWAFDDDDFIRRIRCKGMNVNIVDNPFVIHQYHSHFEFSQASVFGKPHLANMKIYKSGYDPNIPMDYSLNTIFYNGRDSLWTKIKENYDKFYVSYTGSKEQVIPRNLHMIWLGGDVPFKYIRLIATWKKYHPDWNFKIWNDKDAMAFDMINKVAYDGVDNLGVKSDIFRYEILYRYGGLYVDTDFECLKSFDDLLYLDFFAGGRAEEPQVANGLMACKPNDKYLKKIIDAITEKQHNMDFAVNRILKVAGAEFITTIYLEYIKNTTDKTILFPSSFFYPIPNSFRYEIRKDSLEDRIRTHSYVKPDTHCIHLWYTSWLKDEDLPLTVHTIPIKEKKEKGDSLVKFMLLTKMDNANKRRLPSSAKPRRSII